MAEIGSTLREARIRQSIDIGAVEDATKIRAKYLRALENEEFEVLPGPTYVKTFLRTYAEYLGLDAQLLIDRYRTRFERIAEGELHAFSKPPKVRERRIRTPGPPSGGVLLGGVLVAVLVFLIVLGLTGGDNEEIPTKPQKKPVATSTDRADRKNKVRGPRSRERGAKQERKVSLGGLARLVLRPKQPVWVCLLDNKGKALVTSQILQPGQTSGPFKAKSFKASFGNSGVDIRVNGKLLPIPAGPNPVGYIIEKGKLTPLPQGQRPTCTP